MAKRSSDESNAVDVALQATAGVGTSDSPWTGWDTAITWAGDTEYFFKAGHYSYANSPNFAIPGIAITGEAGTFLKHTGTGDAFVMDAGAGATWIQNVRCENLILTGNANTTNGFYLRGIRDGIFSHLGVRGATEAGIYTEACVTNILNNFRCMYQEPVQGGSFVVTPKRGIQIAGRGADWSTTWTIINPVVEGVTEVGIWLEADCYGCTIINGTSEGNPGKGMVIDSFLHTIINTDFEQNTGIDLEVNGKRNTFINILSDHNVTVGSQANAFLGGTFHDFTIQNNADLTRVEGAIFTGTLTNSSNSSILLGIQTPTGGVVLPSFMGSGVTMKERVLAPPTPSANEVVLYAIDNGSGKTQLMALFSSGAAQQVAIQP